MRDTADGETSGRWSLPLRVDWQERDRHRWAGRLAAVGLAAGALLAVLGLPPVDLHSPLHYTGVMAPTCGATRGVHAAMLGHFGEAWRYNPLSLVLVVGAVGLVLRELIGRVRGRWLNVRVTRRRAVVMTGVALLVVLEANQQVHADLLRTNPSAAPSAWLLLPVTLPLAAAVVVLAVVLVRRAGRN
ncbi:hypothetical protein SGM_5235 [Streptomyces griseoaurantiacus M045]|uniref:Uncharacterized protein n=1 Tax=Streptomyces griseoaurantiacus M045 TaxID=996637 RepID=F3NQG0_9ACTN|nr:DUF2752 domain-containing protein [Streptomyces griseoaurantiacus]EGG44420.1 hypothetical protein SGM_5235 [Streptomyces griseoaurantiacus M045]